MGTFLNGISDLDVCRVKNVLNYSVIQFIYSTSIYSMKLQNNLPTIKTFMKYYNKLKTATKASYE